VVALLILALTASQVFADADADAMRSRMRAAGYADAEVRNLIKSGALRDSSVRSAVIARGVPADALEPYVLERECHPATTAARACPGPPTPTAVTQAPPDSLRPFGFEIFGYSPTTFEPLTYGPVDPDYPLGPGDELLLTIWGDDQLALTLPVSRDGM